MHRGSARRLGRHPLTCEVHQRSWREAVRPVRVVLAIAALVCLIAGARYASVFGLGLIGVGAALLLSAVVVPAIREVEFGLPVGVKVTAAVRQREDELRAAFEAQKGDLELCSHLLCGRQEIATELLEAAWARTATLWRGPATPELHDYLLCVLVQLVRARESWLDPEPGSEPAIRSLTALPIDIRVTVVLHEFAGLSFARIATLTDRPVPLVEADVQAAETTFARVAPPGSEP